MIGVETFGVEKLAFIFGMGRSDTVSYLSRSRVLHCQLSILERQVLGI